MWEDLTAVLCAMGFAFGVVLMVIGLWGTLVAQDIRVSLRASPAQRRRRVAYYRSRATHLGGL